MRLLIQDQPAIILSLLTARRHGNLILPCLPGLVRSDVWLSLTADEQQEFLAANPDAKLISLGIGDTTHPLPGPIADAMANYAKGLGTLEGYAPSSRLPLAPCPLPSASLIHPSATFA